jgi:hypothetical protein
MAKTHLASLVKQISRNKQTVRAIASVTIALSICMNSSAVVGDPFRPSNPQAIGPNTETAFKTMFQQGNYKRAISLCNGSLIILHRARLQLDEFLRAKNP